MKINKLFFLAIALFVVSAISAQDVISVNDLAKIMKDKDVLIIWTGAEADYKVHITGAISVPQISLCVTEPIRHMKPTSEMTKILGENGVSADKKIVVYDEGSTKYAGRMYWMLKYLGVSDVKMLNGNLEAWKAARKPITGVPTKAPATTFTAKVNASILASMAEVNKALGNSSTILVDARTPAEYAGTAETKLRKGHIPGAINIDIATLLDSKGLLKSNADLKSLFTSKGVTTDKTVIAYCESSVRAGIIYLALKGLGYQDVKVYDGAYIEWQATASNKVE